MSRYDDTPSLQIRFRWNPNAMRGFAASMGVLCVVLIMSMCVHPPQPHMYTRPDTGPVLVELKFGDGDGTGGRKGNLQEEGAKQSGQKSQNPLEDASRTKESSIGRINPSDPSNHSNLRKSEEVGRKGKNVQGDAERRIGDTDGSEEGTGLGLAGKGSGKGLGFSVDWGGGGNRIVLNKMLPKKPPGSMDTQVRLRFKVARDGRVTSVWPLQRGGDPGVDAVASKAMYQWRFNPIDTDVEMEGTITFTFKTS